VPRGVTAESLQEELISVWMHLSSVRNRREMKARIRLPETITALSNPMGRKTRVLTPSRADR
jgi:hypothetical protein